MPAQPSRTALWSLRASAVAGLFALIMAADSAAPARAADWPGFRGINADGHSAETGVYSARAPFGLKVIWKKSIGSGYSGVSVAGGRAVTMFSDGESDVAAAFDEKTGDELWRFTIEKTYEGHDGSHTGPISTPLIAAGRVFGLGAHGRLFALDAKSGSLIWSTHLVEDHQAKAPGYGFCTSPLLMDGVLVVQIGAEEAAVAGFDPATGKKIWTAGKDEIAYQSPIPFRLNDKRGILSPGEKKLLFLDPAAGSVLWDYDHGGEGFTGVASLVPVPAGDDRLFLAFKEEASTVIEIGAGESGVEAKTLWEGRSIRKSYNVPVYHDEHLYAYTSRFLTCVDVNNGEPVWRSRQPGDGFLILADGHLVIATKLGSVHVAKATADGYEEAAGVDVFDDLIWTPPSFANGHVFVRGLDGLARIGVGPRVAETAAEAAKPDPILDGTRFGRFLAGLRTADDKKAAVDKFLQAQDRFPIIEGDDLVHFIYRGPAEDMALEGDIFGARQDRPMNRAPGTDLFYYSMRLEPDARANYLFIKDFKELLDPRNPRKTATTIYGREMEMSFSGEEMEMSWLAMPKWKPPAYLDGTEPPVRGRLESREFESTALEAAGTKPAIPLTVYLPAGYDSTDRRYPVAYVHAGKAARERGGMDDALDHLIGERVEPLLVVFIDFAPRWNSEGYDKMVVEELIPFVDQNFRTVPAAAGRAHVGAGFAGFLALRCAFMYPGTAASVATQSPFVFGTMAERLKEQVPPAADPPGQIYIEWGKYDLRSTAESWSMADADREFADFLREKGYRVSGGEVNDGTGWPSWRNRIDRVFANLFPRRPTG